MPRMAVLLLSLMLGAGCAVLVSCGSDDSDGTGIPTDAATGMLNELNAARAALDEGDCAKVADSAQDIESAAENLDTTVDAEVRTGLVDGASHLAELANDPSQCQQTTTSTTSTEKPEPETTSTTEPTTTEEETTTTTTTSAEEEPAQPPEEPPGQPPGPPSDEEGTGPGDTGGTGDGKHAPGAKKPKKEKKDKAH